MPGFVAIDPTQSTEHLTSSDFWPPIDLAHVRTLAKLDGTLADARLRQAVLMAMDSINSELAAWEGRQRTAGYSRLSAIPSPALHGQHRLIAQYVQAVVCTASADLLEQMRSYDSSGQGQAKADALTPRIDEQRRAAHWAIAALLGRTRSTVELI